ncbi:MAG: hypothetical protein IPF98_04695 [Gemmatimonadetes bacterium]|nr:hypothetical protein [Gemmatimonadota bacterium]MCC6769725.1 hypothetical protein [Gemmatimonadaceae bacterium]
MVDSKLQLVLADNIRRHPRFTGMSFEKWKVTYQAAWAIMNDGPGDIRFDASSIVNLSSLTHNMYRYCEQHGWIWRSNAGNNQWDDLLKDDKRGVFYDCHSIARALAELCAVLGYGSGVPGSVYSHERKGHIFVLPLHHIGGVRAPLHMFNGEVGYAECGGHQVWSDHQFVVIEHRAYDAMLNVAGIADHDINDQYAEWWAKEVPDATTWVGCRWESVTPGRPVIHRTAEGYTFREVDVEPDSRTKHNPLGTARVWSGNPLYKSPWQDNPLHEPPKVNFKK